MKTTQLANGFATQIEGVDLSRPLDNDTFEIIRNLWMENRIVVFLEQNWTTTSWSHSPNASVLCLFMRRRAC